MHIRHILTIDGHEAKRLGISDKEFAIYDSFWKDISEDFGVVSADFRSLHVVVLPRRGSHEREFWVAAGVVLWLWLL
jgi:hypothetical protein